MSFRELDEFFDDTLKLPIGGKTYVIQSPDSKTGLWVQSMMAVAVAASSGRDVDPSDLEGLRLDDDEEKDLYRRLLGDTYQEMLDDGVRWHKLKHAGETTLFWVLRGKEFAERIWNGAGDPKAPASTPAPASTASEDPPGSPASSTSPDETPGSATPGSTS
jgi:hypothetical protein